MSGPIRRRGDRRWRRAAVLGLLLASGGVGLGAAGMAQDSPESLLPPGFSAAPPARPPHRRTPPAADAPAPARGRPSPESPAITPPTAANDAVDAPGARIAAAPLTNIPGAPGSAAPSGGKASRGPITSFAQLMALPPRQIDALLGLAGASDIPPAARRSMSQVGVIGEGEGGMPSGSLAGQDASLVRAAIAGNSGEMVSRWGHILLRRALASRLDAPVGMDPAEFAGLRAGLLSRMGEGDAARALVQDVDPANYTAPLAQAALDAYRETEDFTGLCPIISQGAGIGTDGRWQVMAAMCQVFSGAPAAGFHQIDRLTYRGALPRTDMLLMQKYAGAAGSSGVEGRSGRRAVTIAWDDVSSLTPLGYSLALAVGLDPPASVLPDPTDAAARPFAAVGALAPALGLGPRADASDVAGGMGVLSAAAMVDLYSQIFGDDGVTGAAADRALSLRDAYVAETPEARLAAMKKLWDSAASPLQRYSRQVLTAYAAARLPPSSDAAADAGDIIAAMLAAGLDANAARWSGVVESGSQGWALVQLVSANDTSLMSEGAISAFRKTDASQGHRKSAFLLAALAGLGRVSDATRGNVAASLGITLDGTTRWTEAIDQAAGYGNPALVALLAGLGMQGSGWDKMTPRYLYHIVGALNRVGLTGEARMIAAEAVARG